MTLTVNNDKEIQKKNKFIEKAIKRHNNKFNYSLANYINSVTEIKIICPIHGIFEQIPATHLRKNSTGCPQCGLEQRKIIRRKTTDEFIIEATAIHGTKFDYNDVDYVNLFTNVKIICPEHGEFHTKPVIHLGGSDCPQCALLNKESCNYQRNTEQFIELSKNKYGNTFAYDNTDYTNKFTKVKIICKEHGEFDVTPRAHLGKSEFGGCPSCIPKTNAGFTKTGWVNHCKNKGVEKSICYIIRLFNDNESFMKIGITTDFKKRMDDFPYKYEIFYLIEEYPAQTYEKEKQLHKKFKKFKYLPNIAFGGQFECFNLNIYN